MNDLKTILIQFVDELLPELTPYENALYIYFLRHSYLNGKIEIRIGKRSIGSTFVRGVRGNRANFSHITSVLLDLEKKGCIKIGDTNREGTLYTILLPDQIPMVKEKLLATAEPQPDDDYFTNPDKRKEVFERDKWICFYCGEKVTSENATLDHYIPQWKGGKHSKENLRTCCLVCNSIKSGKTYEEAAPLLLKNIQLRRSREL